MVRTFTAASILGLLIATTGCCHMCANPYDRCGPVWDRGGCLNCDSDYRAGSILNRSVPVPPGPAARPVPPGQMVKRPAAKPTRRTDPMVVAAVPRDSAPQWKARPVQTTEAVAPSRVQKVEHVAARPPAQEQDNWAPPKPVPPHQRAAVGETEPAPPGTPDGATRILSVTDRKVDEPAPMPPQTGGWTPPSAGRLDTGRPDTGWHAIR